jgi:hypothetical protein
METHINDKINESFSDFKKDLKRFIMNMKANHETTAPIFDFIDAYDIVKITKQDFVKRKRVKNIVPQYDRCIAKIANNEQCTRRKKNDLYCGTHIKGLPHGEIANYKEQESEFKKITVTAKDIRGIFYYIDENMNVYDTEDVLNGKKNPNIVAQYVITNGEYHIPVFGI